MTYTTVLDEIPAKFTAGESISWSVSLSDYPASESWELVYTLIKSDTRIQITASADGDDHLIEVSSATTADYAVGEYEYQAHISNGTEKYEVDAGVVEILTDFATHASGFDSRSTVKKILDAIDTVLVTRSGKTQLAQTIGNVQVEHWSFDQISKMRDVYAAKYRKELVAAGIIKSRKTIKTRFV